MYQKQSYNNTFDKREEYTAGEFSNKQRKDNKNQQNSQNEAKNKRSKQQNKKSSRSRSKKIKSTSEYAFKKLEKELDNKNLQQVLTTDDLDGFLKEIDQGEHQLHLFLKQEEEDLNKRLKEAEKKLTIEDQLDGPIDENKLTLTESLQQYQHHTTVPSSIPHTTQVTNNILDQLSPNNLQKDQKQNGYQDSSSSSSKQSSEQNDVNDYGRRFYQQQKKFNGERATSLETYINLNKNMSHILGSLSANKALGNAQSFMMAHNATMRGNQFSPNNYTAEKVRFDESDNKLSNVKTKQIKLKNEGNQIKKVRNLNNLQNLQEQTLEMKKAEHDFHKGAFQQNKSGKVSDSSIGQDIGNIRSQQVLHTDRPAFGEQRFDLLTNKSVEPPISSAQKQKSNLFKQIDQEFTNKQVELNYQINFQNQFNLKQQIQNSRSMIGPNSRSNERQLSVVSGTSLHSKYSANNPSSLINHSSTTLRSRFPFCSSSKQLKNQFDQHIMNQKYMKKDQMQIQKQTSSSTQNGDIYKSHKIDKNFSSYSIIKSPKDQTKLTSSVFINISDASAGLIKINNTRHYEGNETILGTESIVNGLSISAIKQNYNEDKSIKSPNNSNIHQKDLFTQKNFKFDQKVIKEYNQEDEEESEKNFKRDLSHLVSVNPVEMYSPTSQNSYQFIQTNERQTKIKEREYEKKLTQNQRVEKQKFLSDNELKVNITDKTDGLDPFINPFTAISQSSTKEKNITNIYQVINSIKAQTINKPKKGDKRQVQTVSFKLDLNKPAMLQTFAADQQIMNQKSTGKQPRLSESGDQFILNSQRDKISVVQMKKLKQNNEIQKESIKKLTESQSQQILRPIQQYQTQQQEGLINQTNLIQQNDDKQQISYTQLFKQKQQLSQRKQKSSTVSQPESPDRQDKNQPNNIKLKRRDRGARGQTGNQASLNVIKDFFVDSKPINHSDIQDKNFYQKQHQKSVNSKLSQTYQQIQSNNQSEDTLQTARLNTYKSNLGIHIQAVSSQKKQSGQFSDFKQKQKQSFQKTRNEKDQVSYKIQNKTLEFGSIDSQANQLGVQDSESTNKSMVHAQYYAASTLDDIPSSPTNIQQNNQEIETSFAKDSSIFEDNKVQINTLNDLKKCDRMVELLLGQLKRRRNKNVKIDVPEEDKLNVVLQYWKESLCKDKLIQKLQSKAKKMNETSNGHQSQSHYDINSKFSYKEKWLLQFLEGTDLNSLMTLAEDSSTRTYGELATVDIQVLVGHVCRYLKLDLAKQNYQL